MKTFNKGQVSCDNCWLAIHAPNGGYICMEQIGKSLFEMPGCPGAITDRIVRKAHADVLKARPEAGPEQLAKTKAELDQLLSEAKLLVLQLKSAKLRLEDGPPLAKDIGDKLAENRKKLIDRQSAPIAAAGEREQPLGTVAEPAEPPPASAQQPKTGKAKIKVKIAMNLDLIAEYLCVINGLVIMENDINVAGKEIDNLIQDRDFVKNSHFQLAEKKSALEAKIMEKLMAK